MALTVLLELSSIFWWSDGLHKLFRGVEWWQPDEDCVSELICEATKKTNGTKRGKARTRIIKHFIWQNAAKRLIAILEELEKEN